MPGAGEPDAERTKMGDLDALREQLIALERKVDSYVNIVRGLGIASGLVFVLSWWIFTGFAGRFNDLETSSVRVGSLMEIVGRVRHLEQERSIMASTEDLNRRFRAQTEQADRVVTDVNHQIEAMRDRMTTLEHRIERIENGVVPRRE
jgi:tetrahydromethanopterin S-methyltransferase subunit F